MLVKDPVSIRGPLNRTYIFSRWRGSGSLIGDGSLAFVHDRAFAKDHLRRIAQDRRDDPFNDRLLEVWQLVFQKPWTRPRSVHELIDDLSAKIHRGELFVYQEHSAPEKITASLRQESASEPVIGILAAVSTVDQVRTRGPGAISDNTREPRDAPLQTTNPAKKPEPVESTLDRGHLYRTVGLDTVTATGAGGDTIGAMYDKVYDTAGNQRPAIDNDTANAFDEAYLQAQDISDMRAEGYQMVAKDVAISAAMGPAGVALSKVNRAVPAFSRVVLATPKQLQKKYLKHADDFGVHGPYNKANSRKFNAAIQRHVNHPGTLEFPGSYRGNDVLFHTNPNSGLTVIEKREGGFLSGWKLNEKQLNHVLEDHKL